MYIATELPSLLEDACLVGNLSVYTYLYVGGGAYLSVVSCMMSKLLAAMRLLNKNRPVKKWTMVTTIFSLTKKGFQKMRI